MPEAAIAGDLNRPLWFLNFALVALYHYGLSELFGSWESLQEFKFYSFLIITPIVKFFFLFEGCKTTRSKKEFVLSVLGDTLQCILLWKVVMVYCRGNWYFLFPFIQGFAVLGLDVVCWLVLDKGSDDPTKNRFVVKMSKTPLDYTVMFVISLGNFFTSLAITDYDAPLKSTHVVALALSILLGDFVFGMLHYLAHSVPQLWKSHKIHHEYKKEDLNSLANFYSDLPDGLAMNCGLFCVAIVANVVGGPFAHPMMHAEFLFPALYTHSKYPTMFFNYVGFYELDIVSIVRGEQRIPEFHHQHHYDSSSHFGIIGICPDWLVKQTVHKIVGRKSGRDDNDVHRH